MTWPIINGEQVFGVCLLLSMVLFVILMPVRK